MIVVAVCFAINAVAKRPLVNPGRIALYLFFLVVAVDFVVVAVVLADSPARLPPEAQGEFLGRAVGKSVIPLILSVWLENSFRKKNPPQAKEVSSSVAP